MLKIAPKYLWIWSAVLLFLLQLGHYWLYTFHRSNITVNTDSAWNLITSGLGLYMAIIAALALVFYIGIKQPSVALTLILVGGISNLLDRLFHGGVVDYIHLLFLPRFNIPDLAIVTGAVYYVIDTITRSRSSARSEPPRA